MMMQTKKPAANPLMEIAERIREMREIVGYRACRSQYPWYHSNCSSENCRFRL